MNICSRNKFSINKDDIFIRFGIIFVLCVILTFSCSCSPMCDRVKNIDFSVQRCKTSENTLDIDLIFSPLDSEGRLVKAHGVLDVKLWRQKRAASESDVLLDHWVDCR
jgi:hypothetical protein